MHDLRIRKVQAQLQAVFDHLAALGIGLTPAIALELARHQALHIGRLAQAQLVGPRYLDELLHPMRCKGWSFTGVMNTRLGQFLTGYFQGPAQYHAR